MSSLIIYTDSISTDTIVSTLNPEIISQLNEGDSCVLFYFCSCCFRAAIHKFLIFKTKDTLKASYFVDIPSPDTLRSYNTTRYRLINFAILSDKQIQIIKDYFYNVSLGGNTKCYTGAFCLLNLPTRQLFYRDKYCAIYRFPNFINRLFQTE